MNNSNLFKPLSFKPHKISKEFRANALAVGLFWYCSRENFEDQTKGQ